MAGVSKTTFLAPSHFTQSATKTSGEKQKPNVLIPPSSYKESVQCLTDSKSHEVNVETEKIINENIKLKQRLEKVLSENNLLSSQEAECSGKGKVVAMEVDALKRKIGDLEQEKEILLYEMKEKESLSEIIVKLRSDLRKSKERFIIKDEQVSEQIREYCAVIKKLKNNLTTNEKSFLKEKDNCEKLYLKLRDSEEKYNALKSNYELEKVRFMSEVTQKENERKMMNEKWDERENEIMKLQGRNMKLENEIKYLEKINGEFEQEKIQLLKEKGEMADKTQEMKRDVLKDKETFKNEIITMNNKVQELQRVLDKKNNEILEMNRKTGEMKEKNEMKIEKQQKMIEMKESELKEKQELFQDSLKSKQSEVDKVSKTVEQLRSYIGEIKPRKLEEQLTNENKEMKNILEVLTEENNTLHSTVKLLNIRLSSILEIMAMQERELTGVNMDNKSYEGVLRKWREKVFELMIQLRSNTIVGKNEKNQEKIKIQNLEKENVNLEKERCLLEHKLKDKTAALEVEMNAKEMKEKKLKSVTNDMDVLKSDQQGIMKQFEDIKRPLKAMEVILSTFFANYSKYCNKMTSFGERIHFAACRIQFITGYLNHRHTNVEQSSSDQSSEQCEVLTNENEEHLKDEVEKLQKERMLLLKENKKNNDILMEKTSEITKYFENIIEEKNEKIRKLEDNDSELKTKLSVLQQNYERKCEDFEDVSENVEELKLVLNKEKVTLEKEHCTMMEQQRLEHVEEARVLEQQLNDVRREQTKTIVSLKDALKQVKREKEQAAEMCGNIEREFTTKLERCERKLRNVEKERNSLMMKIKQDKTFSFPPPLKGDVKQPMRSKQAGTSEDAHEHQGVDMDNFEANEALMALQELKVLSKQIVQMQGSKEDK